MKLLKNLKLLLFTAFIFSLKTNILAMDTAEAGDAKPGLEVETSRYTVPVKKSSRCCTCCFGGCFCSCKKPKRPISRKKSGAQWKDTWVSEASSATAATPGSKDDSALEGVGADAEDLADWRDRHPDRGYFPRVDTGVLQARVDDHLFEMIAAGSGHGKNKIKQLIGSVDDVAGKMAAAEAAETAKADRSARRRAGSSASATNARSSMHGQHSGDFSDIASPIGSTDRG